MVTHLCIILDQGMDQVLSTGKIVATGACLVSLTRGMSFSMHFFSSGSLSIEHNILKFRYDGIQKFIDLPKCYKGDKIIRKTITFPGHCLTCMASSAYNILRQIHSFPLALSTGSAKIQFSFWQCVERIIGIISDCWISYLII